MPITPWYTVWCEGDNCLQWHEHGGHTKKEAWENAKTIGGWRKVNGKILCFDCQHPRLCDLPWDALNIGDKVISLLGTTGKIIGLNPNDRYPSIDFVWDNGKVSYGNFHMQCKVQKG